MNYETKLIIKDLKQKGFHVAKGLISLNEFQIVKKESISFFEKKQLRKESFPKALRGDVKAGMLNNFGFSSNKAWRLYRLCSFPWNRKEKELVNTINLSRKLSSFRNEIIGMGSTEDYGSFIENDGYIQYTSLSLYPSDGGFLNKHRDSHPIEGDEDESLVHFKLEITHKNIDYSEGGFYVWDRQNNEICVSSLVEPGDVIFFDGSLPHEIKPIYGKAGRIALFEIPTYVNNLSRNLDYAGDGETISFTRRVKNKIKNTFDKIFI